MQRKSSKERFDHQLQAALNNLYDPSKLRNSPLAEVFSLSHRRDLVHVLRRALLDAIEAQRPTADMPRDSKSWRVYQILRRRYTEQLTQREVASDLGLSTRQLQREEKYAREVLAEYLWQGYKLATKESSVANSANRKLPTRAEELERLKETVPAQMTEVETVIWEAVETINPLLQSLGVSIEVVSLAEPISLPLQSLILRQALLNLVSSAARCVAGGRIRIEALAEQRQVHIHIYADRQSEASPVERPDCTESLEMADQLVQLCGGSLELDNGEFAAESLAAKIILPVTKQVTVLVVDDNADALQLIQRYLSGTRYRAVSTENSDTAVSLALEIEPDIILLDVLMPEDDGWMLLGHLREHPRTQGVPIVVCTIIPQEQLALVLGAADFLRKPISRTQLLETLDRQLVRLQTDSDSQISRSEEAGG